MGMFQSLRLKPSQILKGYNITIGRRDIGIWTFLYVGAKALRSLLDRVNKVIGQV